MSNKKKLNSDKPKDIRNNSSALKEKNELTQEEILKIKEVRIKGNAEEEEETPKKEDTKFIKILKSLGYFWDYYKWYVIIPATILLIAVVFIDNYRRENRECSIRIAIVNEVETIDTVNRIEDDYTAYRGIDQAELPVKLYYDFTYPKDRDVITNSSRLNVESMQKYNAMVIGEKVDATIANTWLFDDYTFNRNFVDLRDILDEEFIEENYDRLYWALPEEGEAIPVGLYVGDSTILTEFTQDDEPPVVGQLVNAVHPEEATEFIKWMRTTCTGDLSEWLITDEDIEDDEIKNEEMQISSFLFI